MPASAWRATGSRRRAVRDEARDAERGARPEALEAPAQPVERRQRADALSLGVDGGGNGSMGRMCVTGV